MQRRPVGVAYAQGTFIVVCDDGSVWHTAHVTTRWLEGAPIPGSPATTPAAAGAR
ncbi:MAG TPA: hypothetical protein VFK09_10590 [Gemmatimonadales bacterium]|jgi:hypothetical protein|nr:hypothetical protein [Gemmatimonadales bacterium]